VPLRETKGIDRHPDDQGEKGGAFTRRGPEKGGVHPPLPTKGGKGLFPERRQQRKGKNKRTFKPRKGEGDSWRDGTQDPGVGDIWTARKKKTEKRFVGRKSSCPWGRVPRKGDTRPFQYRVRKLRFWTQGEMVRKRGQPSPVSMAGKKPGQEIRVQERERKKRVMPSSEKEGKPLS